MLKITLKKIQNAFKDDPKSDNVESVNNLMCLIFKEKTTTNSIKIFTEFQKQFEKEIAKRGLDACIEQTVCEEYFYKK